jgi:hypothetical protein
MVESDVVEPAINSGVRTNYVKKGGSFTGMALRRMSDQLRFKTQTIPDWPLIFPPLPKCPHSHH